MSAVHPAERAASAVSDASDRQDRLKLTEIFLSLQGEARDAGWPTVFVRLTGCPLRCQYCDTAYAFYGGAWWDWKQACGNPHVVNQPGGQPVPVSPSTLTNV